MSEDGPIAEATDCMSSFLLRAFQILIGSGIVDREDGIGEGAIGDRSGFGEAAGVGGVGEVDVVEGVAFACGTIVIFGPGGVEREKAEVSGGD